MKVSHPNSDLASNSAITPGRLIRLVGLAVLLTVVLLGIFIAVQPAAMQRALARYESDSNGGIFSFDKGLGERFSAALGGFFQQTIADVPDIPHFVVDVPFEGIQRIYAKREQALQQGHLVQGENDFVKGEIRFNGEFVPIRLRLKGDWNDHLIGSKWSFRVHTRSDAQLLGMRRFSLQNPNTRGFQSEVLFFETLRRYDVLTPRYSFANLTLNGESLGIMAIEEFFAKELLEHNGRKDGVIIRFDESLVWSANDSLSGERVGFAGAFDDYRNAPIDAFESGRIAESPVLTAQYESATSLLRAFVEGTLAASDVFDSEQLGRYIAIADAFGAWHSLSWHNLRFYLNPITMRLEPIGFDASMQSRYSVGRSVVNHDPFILDVMADEKIYSAYKSTIEALSRDVTEQGLIEHLRSIETPILALLRTEFRTLEPWPLDELIYRLGFLNERLGASNAMQMHTFLDKPHESRLYPALLHAEVLKYPAPHTLELRNAIPFDVEIFAITWVDGDGETINALSSDISLTLPARGIGSLAPVFTQAVSAPPAPEGWQLMVAAKIPQRPWYQTIPARPGVPAAGSAGLPTANIEVFVQTHPFIEVDGNNKTVTIPSGEWQFDQSLILPTGYALNIEGDTHLRMTTAAMIVVRGPLTVLGSADTPVTIDAVTSEGWPGIAILEAGGHSQISHTRIGNIRGLSEGAWSLTGGIVFYRSDVDITSSQFFNSRGEDALNIVHSNFLLDNIEITMTAADAFDGDFATGIVRNSRFTGIRGDAIDVSGSSIEVIDVGFNEVADKAISVGEASQVDASRLIIENVGSGVAVKDGSRLRLVDSSISQASFAALTAYIKKPEYGPAQINATNISVENVARPTLVQTGNMIELNGELIVTEDVDVDALYDTVMLPSLPK